MKETGTDTTYWAGKAHYLRDAFVIFEEQYADSATNSNSGVWGSIQINNYQWFTYGRSPLDSVREGDRAADYMDRYCTNENRIISTQFESNSLLDKSTHKRLASRIEVYPNPASDKILISSNIPLIEITLYNMLMEELHSETIQSKHYIMQLKNYNAGTYFIKIIDNMGGQTIKNFVKQ